MSPQIFGFLFCKSELSHTYTHADTSGSLVRCPRLYPFCVKCAHFYFFAVFSLMRVRIYSFEEKEVVEHLSIYYVLELQILNSVGY